LCREIAAKQDARAVPDPFGLGTAAFERVLDLIENGSRLLAGRVAAAPGGPR